MAERRRDDGGEDGGPDAAARRSFQERSDRATVPQTRTTRTAPRGHGETILVVDDDPSVLRSLRRALESDGYATIVAGDWTHALDVLRTLDAPPALILLDVSMPGLNGFQFRVRQLADPAFAAIPLVVVSAESHHDLVRLAAAGYLRKPFRREELLETIARLLGDGGQ